MKLTIKCQLCTFYGRTNAREMIKKCLIIFHNLSNLSVYPTDKERPTIIAAHLPSLQKWLPESDQPLLDRSRRKGSPRRGRRNGRRRWGPSRSARPWPGAVAGEMLVSTMVAARLFLENTTDVTLDSGPDKSMLGCWDQGSKVHNGLLVAGLGWRSWTGRF